MSVRKHTNRCDCDVCRRWDDDATVEITPEGAAALAQARRAAARPPACPLCGGRLEVSLSELLQVSPQELAEGYCLDSLVPCPACVGEIDDRP